MKDKIKSLLAERRGSYTGQELAELAGDDVVTLWRALNAVRTLRIGDWTVELFNVRPVLYETKSIPAWALQMLLGASPEYDISNLDTRMPKQEDIPECLHVAVNSLEKLRNTCSDEEVEKIDRALMSILMPYIQLLS